MSIKLNDNIKINAGKPIESKYLSSGNTAYTTINAVTTAITIPERYLGLTVLVASGTSNIEFWWKESVDNSGLIEKKFSSEQLVGDFITGATNLGFFSGQTGIQKLTLSGFPSTPIDFDGDYYSQYNWYYSDADGIIRIGSPVYNGPLRRAYVDSTRTKSWIYDVNTSAWILSSNDVTANVGSSINGYDYNGSGYTQTEWLTYQTNGSTSITSEGSLTTGNTLTIGTPIYNNNEHQNINLRTIKSDTPTIINVRNDDNFIYLSGFTDTTKLLYAENGLTKTNQTIKLGGNITGLTTLTLSDTGTPTLSITDNRITPVGIQYNENYSDTFTARSLVDAGYVTGKTNSGALMKSVYIQPEIGTYNVTNDDYFIGARSALNSGSTICLPTPSPSNCGMIVVVADYSGYAHCYPIQIGGTIIGFPLAQINTCFGSMSFINNGSSWNVIGFASAPA